MDWRGRERLEMLREMGLSPVWQRRVALSVSASSSAEPGANRAAIEIPAQVLAAAATAAPTEARVVAAQARLHEIALLEWDELEAHIAQCTACSLCRTRRKTVPGVGLQSADWMIVGEAPGAEEDAQGEPFVGQAGRLLDNMLKAIGLTRGKEVFIANVLKCRPPNNRNPEPAEIALCSPYLERQLELIRPRLIVAMGRFAALTLLDTDATIASLRGRIHTYRGVPLIVSYHPAYLLRNLPEKAKAWEDLVFAKRTFAGLQASESSPS